MVEEVFHEVGCGIRKGKPRKDEVARVMVKVVELMRICKEHEVLITIMEKEVNELLELLIARKKAVPDDIPSPVLELLSVDRRDLQMPKSSDKDVPEDEDQGNEEGNMFSRIKRDPPENVSRLV